MANSEQTYAETKMDRTSVLQTSVRCTPSTGRNTEEVGGIPVK